MTVWAELERGVFRSWVACLHRAIVAILEGDTAGVVVWSVADESVHRPD
jgi:hypothetical protein